MNEDLLIPVKPTRSNYKEYFLYLHALFAKNKKEGLPLPTIDKYKRIPTFPQKIYLIVEFEDHDSIGWCQDQKSIYISNEKIFMEKVCPKYFQSESFAFLRSINFLNNLLTYLRTYCSDDLSKFSHFIFLLRLHILYSQ